MKVITSIGRDTGRKKQDQRKRRLHDGMLPTSSRLLRSFRAAYNRQRMDSAFVARFCGTLYAVGAQVSNRHAPGGFRAGRISVRSKEVA